ncbi:DNA topoisomerase 3-alpha, partial [Anoplophora glabripennis]
MKFLKLSLRFFSNDFQSAIMRYLNVAEKNDAAKNIAAILSRGASTRREGLSQYNKIYEFDTQVFGEQARMVMTSVSGHLLNYEFSAAYKNWQSCNPVTLFDAPVIKTCPPDFQNIKRTLEREIVYCQGLIIWTDCDREGENIGFEIIKVCTDIKPNIRIYRAKFSEITAASVFHALNTLGQPNKNVSDAVDVRQELDLRTGAAFTRLQTLRLQRVFPQKLAEKLISYGSCQFPTLGFVVERYQAIENFISEAFWRIKMNHTVKDTTTDFSWKRVRLFDKNSCEAILDHCRENPQATVESVESKEKSKWRPLPLDTVEMEKIVSRKLRINAKDAMKIAEKLYTQGYISYPRTETNIFPKELNLTPLVEQQMEDARWGPFARRIMNEGGPNPRQGKKSDKAHPPIHPTKYAANLTGNEQKIYEYIVRHFLACVQKDAKGFETTVNVDIAGEKFTAKGLIILEKNYLDVYVYEGWNTKEISNYHQGDTFMPTVLDIIDSSTTPPKLLTEADLIALMEKHGIGTDATHAEHIDKIKSRDYVGLHENMYFVPGTLGMGLVEGYNNIGLEVSLAKPVLRAEFENDLKLICDGLKNPEEVRVEQITKYRAVFQTVLDKMRLIDDSLANRLDDRPQAVNNDFGGNQNDHRPVLKCPKCGNDMVVRNRKNGLGKYLTCINFPNCKNSVWFPMSVENIEILNEHCGVCGPNVKQLKLKFKQNPFPGEPNPNVLCIGGCDLNVLETLNINPSSVRRTTTLNDGINENASSRNNLRNYANAHRNNEQNNGVSRFNNIDNSITHTHHNFSNRDKHQNRNNTEVPGNYLNIKTNKTPVNLMPGPSRTNANNSIVGSTGQEDDIVCSCNNKALLLTVRKDGSNKGRQFYKCASDTCKFFLWAVDDGTSSNVRHDDQQTNRIHCNCHQPAVLRTVSKAGPNTGRQFYSCPKPLGDSCNFFKWADETNENTGGEGDDDWGGGGNITRRNWNGNNSNWRGKSNKGKQKPASNKVTPYTGQTRAKRKCGICGQE